MSDAWTIGRLLQWTAGFLKDRGAESPRLDAEVLLAHVRLCPRIALYTAYEEVADESTRNVFRELVKQRAAGKPVAYLVGRREFYSLSFRVTQDVLIPRPETEFVVIGLLDAIKQAGPRDAPWRIADVGTGSGILAVCAAKKIAHAAIAAIDLSSAALHVARENAAEHGVSAMIDFIESDLLADVPADRTFDFIVSNPPYVATREWEQLKPEVRDYEPRMALEAGPLGTEIIARLIPQAAERLAPGGSVFVEISPMIEPAALAIVSAESRLESLPTIKDLAGLSRVVVARRR